MPSSATYQKSAKGSQAIATRDHSLPPKTRSMLILVDGKRSTDELGKLGGMLGDPQQLLAQLLEQGYIEVCPSASAAAEPAAAAPVRTGVPLAEAKRFAVRKLTDLLGPAADDLCMRIESTRNAQDFMQAMKGAEKMVRDFRGEDMARRFAQELEEHRPA